MYDPLKQMLQRKDDNRNTNIIRNRLQLHARTLVQRTHQLCASKGVENIDVTCELIGEIKGYIELRASLSPNVPQDNYSAELYRCMNKLKASMATHNV